MIRNMLLISALSDGVFVTLIDGIEQIKYYDQYGREKTWVDYSDHGYPDDHVIPHWHEVIYDNEYPLGIKIDHRMDSNIPSK